jgi:hypothetical protein
MNKRRRKNPRKKNVRNKSRPRGQGRQEHRRRPGGTDTRLRRRHHHAHRVHTRVVLQLRRHQQFIAQHPRLCCHYPHPTTPRCPRHRMDMHCDWIVRTMSGLFAWLAGNAALKTPGPGVPEWGFEMDRKWNERKGTRTRMSERGCTDSLMTLLMSNVLLT